MNKTTRQLLVTAAVAGILSAAPSFAAAKKGHCMGGNACKGNSTCKTAQNSSCSGKNDCKGMGMVENTKAECNKIKAEWKKSKDKKDKDLAKKIKWEAAK